MSATAAGLSIGLDRFGPALVYAPQRGDSGTQGSNRMETVAALAAGATPVARRRFAPWLVLAGALGIPCVYLPTLATPFDFIDDGNLVYPAPPMPFGERLALVWDKVVANYEHLGPFRPVLWVHWEPAAELFQGDAVRWRAARLVWSGLAVAALLALLRELGVRR